MIGPQNDIAMLAPAPPAGQPTTLPPIPKMSDLISRFLAPKPGDPTDPESGDPESGDPQPAPSEESEAPSSPDSGSGAPDPNSIDANAKKLAYAIGMWENRDEPPNAHTYKRVNSIGATGRYQFMPDTLRRDSKKYLGQSIDQSTFRQDPEIQDQLMFLKTKDALQQQLEATGGDMQAAMRNVAILHYHGSLTGNLDKKAVSRAKDKNGNPVVAESPNDYASNVLKRVGDGGIDATDDSSAQEPSQTGAGQPAPAITLSPDTQALLAKYGVSIPSAGAKAQPQAAEAPQARQPWSDAEFMEGLARNVATNKSKPGALIQAVSNQASNVAEALASNQAAEAMRNTAAAPASASATASVPVGQAQESMSGTPIYPGMPGYQKPIDQMERENAENQARESFKDIKGETGAKASKDEQQYEAEQAKQTSGLVAAVQDVASGNPMGVIEGTVGTTEPGRVLLTSIQKSGNIFGIAKAVDPEGYAQREAAFAPESVIGKETADLVGGTSKTLMELVAVGALGEIAAPVLGAASKLVEGGNLLGTTTLLGQIAPTVSGQESWKDAVINTATSYVLGPALSGIRAGAADYSALTGGSERVARTIGYGLVGGINSAASTVAEGQAPTLQSTLSGAVGLGLFGGIEPNEAQLAPESQVTPAAPESQSASPVSDEAAQAAPAQQAPSPLEGTSHEAAQPGKYVTEEPLMSYTIARGDRAGQERTGVIAKDLTLDQARAIDPYAHVRGDGIFISERHVARPDATPVAQSEQTAQEGQPVETVQTIAPEANETQRGIAPDNRSGELQPVDDGVGENGSNRNGEAGRSGPREADSQSDSRGESGNQAEAGIAPEPVRETPDSQRSADRSSEEAQVVQSEAGAPVGRPVEDQPTIGEPQNATGQIGEQSIGVEEHQDGSSSGTTAEASSSDRAVNAGQSEGEGPTSAEEKQVGTASTSAAEPKPSVFELKKDARDLFYTANNGSMHAGDPGIPLGIDLPARQSKATKAAYNELVAKGFVNDGSDELTPKGIAAHNERLRIQDEGADMSERIPSKGLPKKQAWQSGEIDGEPFKTEGHIIIKGDAPDGADALSADKNAWAGKVYFNDAKVGDPVRPIGFTRGVRFDPEQGIIHFDNGVAVDEKYVDEVLKSHPDAVFHSWKDGGRILAITDHGEQIGAVMGIDHPTPEKFESRINRQAGPADVQPVGTTDPSAKMSPAAAKAIAGVGQENFENKMATIGVKVGDRLRIDFHPDEPIEGVLHHDVENDTLSLHDENGNSIDGSQIENPEVLQKLHEKGKIHPVESIESADPNQLSLLDGEASINQPGKSTSSAGYLGSGLGGLQPLLEGVGPAVKELVQQDIKPTAQKVADALGEAAQNVRGNVAPSTAGVEAEAVALKLRAGGADTQQAMDILDRDLKPIRKEFQGKSVAENWDFMARVMEGRPLDSSSPDFQKLQDARDALELTTRAARNQAFDVDQRYQDVYGPETGVSSFIVSYFPNLFKKAGGLFGSARQFVQRFGQEPGSFKGRRVYEEGKQNPALDGLKANADLMIERHGANSKEAQDALNYYRSAKQYNEEFGRTDTPFLAHLASGQVPISDNPVDLVLSHAQQTQAYVMQKTAIGEMVRDGYFVKSIERVPGMERVNGALGEVLMKNENGDYVRGHIYAPPKAAKLIENYASEGLSKFAVYRGYRATTNIMNQAELGLSAMHAFGTSLNAVATQIGSGIKRAVDGLIDLDPKEIGKGLGTVLASPAAPFTFLTTGGKMLREWMDPGKLTTSIAAKIDAARMEGKPTNHLESQLADATRIQDMVGAVKTGGARAYLHQEFATKFIEQTADAWHKLAIGDNPIGNAARVLFKAPLAAAEGLALPIMRWWVPRMKMGAQAMMIDQALRSLPEGATDMDIARETARAVDSADNRFGQVVYDNWFMNRVAKDAMMALVGRPGWTVGTIKELGGGVGDILGLTSLAKGQGLKPQFTDRAAYSLVGLPIAVAATNSLLQYMLTQQLPTQTNTPLEDMLLGARTGKLDSHGNPERVAPINYIKDVYSYVTDLDHAVELGDFSMPTVKGKLAPPISAMTTLAGNLGYWGNQIHDTGKPMFDLDARLQDAKFLASNYFVPYTIQNAGRLADAGDLGVMSYAGITPVPPRLSMTLAQTAQQGIGAAKRSAGGRTVEEQRKFEAQDDIRRGYAQGGMAEAENRMKTHAGVLSNRDMRRISMQLRSEPKGPPSMPSFAKDSPADALRIYGVANDKEKQELRPFLDRIVNRANPSNTSPDELQRIGSEYQRLVGGAGRTAQPTSPKPTKYIHP